MHSSLRDSELFNGLTDDELKLVAAVITEREVKAGEAIIHEGAEAFSLYGIESGSVEVTKQTSDGTNPRITELSRGSIFGEMAFLDKPPRSAGIVAQSDCRIFELTYENLDRLASEHPKLGLKLYRSLANSLSRKTRKTTLDLVSLVGASRLAALGEMTSGIAHEIKTPLTSIIVNAEVLRVLIDSEAKDPAKMREQLERIRTTSMKVAKIVDGMKRLSRDDSMDSTSRVSVGSLIEDVLILCRERFQNNGITLYISAIPGQTEIECQPVQISQVLLNLLNNAHDAVETAPKKYISVQIQKQPGWIEISVTDSGKGITEELRSRIYEPFFTTKPTGRGTGLGLSISKGIIERHGGELKLDPKAPNTTFIIRLPLPKQG